MNLETGMTLGHYKLLEKLGEGGMGVVWKAQDLTLDRLVAVKFMPEGLAEDSGRRTQFEREAKAVAALHHPGIVMIYAIEEAEGSRFLVMEYVKGEPLTSRLVSEGLPLDQFFKIALPLTEAVAAAHERGIIHRDLKPGNIMIDSSGRVKVLDFGLAQIMEAASPLTSTDRTVTAGLSEGITGTILYMSPEQLRGEALDHRTDLFALGTILYEMATGVHPFAGPTGAETIAAILKSEPRPANELNPRLPRTLDRVLRRLLEKSVRYRTESAVDLRDELEKLRREGPEEGSEGLPSVAVLPFVDMSREKDQAYFCEGIAEEITNALCRIQGLRVASRTAAFQFKDQAAELREIARRLGVETLLEGSVRKAGHRLRITAQLIDARGGFHIWSECFDRELRDIFRIQEEIARSIAVALRVTLSPQEKGRLEKVPTRHVQAYDYYLRGRSFYYRYAKRDIEFALQLFTRAIELDPGYTSAWAGLADCWSFIYLYSERQDSVRLQAESAGRRAVELDPGSAQAQASLAVAMSLGGQPEDAESGFQTAIRLDPNLFEAWYFYARHAFVNGDLENAVRCYAEAIRIRPDDFQSSLLSASVYDALGRKEEATAARRRGLALAEEYIKFYPDNARAIYMCANALVALGERDKGLVWARRARAIEPNEPMLLYNLGCIYSLAGEIEEGISCLEKAVELGLTQKGWFEHDSDLDPLRSHPKFKALMDKLS